jgi:hypothetical protein
MFHNVVIIVLKQSALSLNRPELFTKKRKFLRIAARSCANFDSHLATAVAAFGCGFLYLTCIRPAVTKQPPSDSNFLCTCVSFFVACLPYPSPW